MLAEQRHYAYVARRARRSCPPGPITLNHLGMPFPDVDRDAWRAAMRRFARAAARRTCSSPACRSCSASAGATPTRARVLDDAFDIFGPQRLLFASDWPMLLRFATLRRLGARGRALRAPRGTVAADDRTPSSRGNALRANPRLVAPAHARRTPLAMRSTENHHETIADQRRHRPRAAALREHGIRLPEYAYWTPDDWRRAGPEYAPRHAQRARLGVSPTSARATSSDIGITMFDVRNGTPERPDEGTPYGEKIFVLQAGPAAAVSTSTGTRPRTSSATPAAR